jgi:hypothetical protein
MPSQRAVDLWETLRQNLIDRELLLDEPQPETDQRQIAAIERVLNPPAHRVGLAQVDSETVLVSKSKDDAGDPRLKAVGKFFERTFLPGHAMVVQYKDGSINIESRKVTW